MGWKDFQPLEQRLRGFRAKPFPTQWARVVNDVGIASLGMAADKWFDEFIRGHNSMKSVTFQLRQIVQKCDRILPALDETALLYFAEMRSIALECLDLARKRRPFDAIE
jgi:hypothetical protein